MPKFDASTFSEVEYDLTGFKSTKDNATYKRGDFISEKGTIPEPSRHQVSETMKAISAAFKEMDVKGAQEMGENPTPEQVAKAMEMLDAEDEKSFENFSDTLVEVVADFCQGHPSMDALDSLAWPKFMAFFGYIMENMLSPEASVPGTNTTPRTLRSV